MLKDPVAKKKLNVKIKEYDAKPLSDPESRI